MAVFGTKVTAVVCCAETMTRLYFVMINLQKPKFTILCSLVKALALA